MDRQLAERMVGAACLLAVLVLVVPAILDGNPDSGATITHPPDEESLDLRQHTIRLDRTDRETPVPVVAQVSGSPAAAPLSLPEPPPVAQESVAAEDQQPEPVPQGSAVAPDAEAAIPAVTRDPVRPLAQEAGAASGEWFVQLGSFEQRENSQRLVEQLEAKGFSASVLGGGGASDTLYRVRAGPESDKASAEALAERLAEAGFKGVLVGKR
ncbi:MAG: SPOR domain-containing protein [Gammaproteobacteria bacterium]|nr:SPOR domain-containing protein [Gammaproteobacteria bacterium]